jgi:hypothetical protein
VDRLRRSSNEGPRLHERALLALLEARVTRAKILREELLVSPGMGNPRLPGDQECEAPLAEIVNRSPEITSTWWGGSGSIQLLSGRPVRFAADVHLFTK